MNVMLLQAQAQGGGYGMLIMMVAIFAIMYFFMIRPQQKQQKKIREFQNALKENDKVVLGGGIHGTVRRVDLANGVVEVEIARGVVVTVDKNGVYADSASQPQKYYISRFDGKSLDANIQVGQELLVQFGEQGVSDFFVLSRIELYLLVDDDAQ